MHLNRSELEFYLDGSRLYSACWCTAPWGWSWGSCHHVAIHSDLSIISILAKISMIRIKILSGLIRIGISFEPIWIRILFEPIWFRILLRSFERLYPGSGFIQAIGFIQIPDGFNQNFIRRDLNQAFIQILRYVQY